MTWQYWRPIALAALICGTWQGAMEGQPLAAASVPAPAHLSCDFLVDPQGIDDLHPRLGWMMQSTENGARQTGYEVIVASSASLLKAGHGDLWDTGKVKSNRSIQLEYGGRPLAPCDACWWAVRTWDETGRPSAWSKPSTWTMGLLAASDWKAR